MCRLHHVLYRALAQVMGVARPTRAPIGVAQGFSPAMRAREGPTSPKVPGGHRREVTPVPIPNTVVKLSSADGTAGATSWESRSLPGFIIEAGCAGAYPAFFLVRSAAAASCREELSCLAR